ncbi:carbon-nitrogen hydrolase family protein [Yinghuangia aomiensis]
MPPVTLDRAPLRVAAAQAHALAGNVAENVATAAQLVRFAAASGADIVVLPEMFLSGYDLDLIRSDPAACDVVPGDRRLDDLAAACYASRTVAVVGAAVRRGGRRTMSLIVVGLDGEAQIAYDAQHLPRDARTLFEPGDHGCSVEVRGWRLGLGTRSDIGFPEHVRAATMDGCDAYLCSGLFTRGDLEYRRGLYLATRALENTCYTVLASHVGATGDGPACGPQRRLRPRRTRRHRSRRRTRRRHHRHPPGLRSRSRPGKPHHARRTTVPRKPPRTHQTRLTPAGTRALPTPIWRPAHPRA